MGTCARNGSSITVSIVATAITLISAGANAANWFDGETRNCDFEAPLPISAPFKKNKNAVGGQYFTVSKSDLNLVLTAPGGAVRTSQSMSTAELAALKSSVEAMRTGPAVASAAIGILGEIADFTAVYGLGAGGMMAWLSSTADAHVLSVDRLTDFVTAGGSAGHDVAFRSAPAGFKPLIFVATTYQIQVGTEPKPRRWLFSVCLLPVEIELSEVETTGGMNDKRLLRQADGRWRRWDITDQKYERGYLYIEQDEVFAYFQEVDDPTISIRIHMYGGPWQRSSNDGITWSTTYLTTNSK